MDDLQGFSSAIGTTCTRPRKRSRYSGGRSFLDDRLEFHSGHYLSPRTYSRCHRHKPIHPRHGGGPFHVSRPQGFSNFVQPPRVFQGDVRGPFVICIDDIDFDFCHIVAHVNEFLLAPYFLHFFSVSGTSRPTSLDLGDTLSQERQGRPGLEVFPIQHGWDYHSRHAEAPRHMDPCNTPDTLLPERLR